MRFDGGTGTTLNFSPSGVYFLTASSFSTGDALSFELRLSPPMTESSICLECHGRVLRVESRPDGFGIAATIESLWVASSDELAH